MRTFLLLTMATACTHQSYDFEDGVSPLQWASEPCASQECYVDDAITVEADGNRPLLSFPEATPDQRLPNVLEWVELDGEVLEDGCDAVGGRGHETGLFGREDYPLRVGDAGDSTAFQRLFGAPDTSAFEVEVGQLYAVTPSHKDRFSSASGSRIAWEVLFMVTPDGLDYALSVELCDE